MPVAIILNDHDAEVLEVILRHHMDDLEKAIRAVPHPGIGREPLQQGLEETGRIRFALKDARR